MERELYTISGQLAFAWQEGGSRGKAGGDTLLKVYLQCTSKVCRDRYILSDFLF